MYARDGLVVETWQKAPMTAAIFASQLALACNRRLVNKRGADQREGV